MCRISGQRHLRSTYPVIPTKAWPAGLLPHAMLDTGIFLCIPLSLAHCVCPGSLVSKLTYSKGLTTMVTTGDYLITPAQRVAKASDYTLPALFSQLSLPMAVRRRSLMVITCAPGMNGRMIRMHWLVRSRNWVWCVAMWLRCTCRIAGSISSCTWRRLPSEQ